MEDIKDGEVDLVTGLKQSRAYGILCAKEIGALRFIKIRNPWEKMLHGVVNGVMVPQNGRNILK